MYNTKFMAQNSKDYTPKRCIDYANELIELCGLPFSRISTIRDIDSNFFVALFECITGHVVPDLFVSNDSTTDAHNIQAVIDTVSLDLLSLSLSHITGEDIVSGNIISILNLLEVLEAVFVHLPPKKELKSKRSIDSSSGENSKQVFSLNKPIKDSESSQSSLTESQENIPPKRLLKRKTCKNTLKKSHLSHPVLKKKMSDTPIMSSHSKRDSDTGDSSNSVKMKISKTDSRTFKRLHTKGIEELHNSNFEKKVRALLQSDVSPVSRSRKLKKNYVQSLNTPLKRTSIPSCKKSFLLPYNLRRKVKSPIRKHISKKRTSSGRKRSKSHVSENFEKCEKDAETVPSAIQHLLTEFPGFKFPKNTLPLLTKQYYQHVSLMHKHLKNSLLKKPTTVIQTEKAMEEEAKLSKILTKDLKEKTYLRELLDHKILENRIKSSLSEARTQSVKMRQYFDEFQKSMSRKLQKRNFSEEVLVEKTFKEILDLQKEKVRLLCERVKETDEHDAKQHRQYLNALKNLYQDQLDLLTESVNAEQKESSEREKAQKLATEKFNKEILKTLQKEVRSLQNDVVEMIEDIHFRELDAQNFIRSFQLQDS